MPWRWTAALLALACGPAAAEVLPGPGLWVLAEAPALPPAALAEACAAAPVWLFADGALIEWRAAPLGPGGAPVLEWAAEAACDRDPDAGRMHCEGDRLGAEAPAFEVRDFAFDRDAEGHLRATTLVGESSAGEVSYPQPCPDDAVRDALRGGILPRP